MITEKQLELALKHRAEFGLKLGQSLVELGFVTEADMVEALRHQARFPCLHLTRGIVDLKVAAKLSEEVSRRLRALALNQFAGHTTVALEDPSDVRAMEELAHILATRIFPVYAEPSAILENLAYVFGEKGKSRPPALGATAVRRLELPPGVQAPERKKKARAASEPEAPPAPAPAQALALGQGQ